MTGISRKIIASASVALAAGTISAAELPEDQGCGLYVSPQTESLYPEGLLKLAAKECWAGPDTHIVIVSMNDVFPAIGAHRHAEVDLAEARENLGKIVGPEISKLFSSVQNPDDSPYLSISGRALAENSTALTYRFDDAEARHVFVAVVDPVHHIMDELASLAGTYSGDVLNMDLGIDLDKKSIRTDTLAHEAGHGLSRDGLMVVKDGVLSYVEGDDVPQEVRLQKETAADVYSDRLYAHALESGIDLDPNYPGTKQNMRAMGSFFAGHDPDGPPMAHATNIGSHAGYAGVSPAEHLEGMNLFRGVLAGAIGDVLLDSRSMRVREGILAGMDDEFVSGIHFCAPSEEGIDPAVGAENQEKLKERFVKCILNSHQLSAISVAGLISLDQQAADGKDPFQGNAVARIFADDFKEAILARSLDELTTRQLTELYTQMGPERMSEENQTKWNEFFTPSWERK